MSADRATLEVERIRDLLRDVGLPAEPVRGLSARDEAALGRILSGEADAHPLPVPGRDPWRRPAVRVAVAAAAVAGIVVGGVAWQGDGAPAAAGTVPLLAFAEADVASVRDGAAPPARDVLLRLADAASAQPVVAGEGYQEISTYAWWLATTDRKAVVSPTHRTVWAGPDGSFLAQETRGPALDLDGRVIDGTYPPGGADGLDRFPPGAVPMRVAGLPRDPEALRTALADADEENLFQDDRTVAELLVNDVYTLYNLEIVPPDLAAAAWRMLADEPALVALGATTDRLGRPGEAIAVPMRGDPAMGVTVLVISPVDGRLLEWESILTSFPDLGISSPTVTGFNVLIESRWVAEPPDL